MTVTLPLPRRLAPRASEAVRSAIATPSGRAVGWRHGGLRPGPRVLVGVASALLDPLDARLRALPSLPWMRGRVDLVGLDALADDLWTPRTPVDATLAIPAGDAPGAARIVLRLCARLGMIEGRGLGPL